tara:strand:- start:463 stop:777 length:315 start_codon:yes stop_codon:yes gene_type:complete
MNFASCPPVYTLPGTWQKFDPVTCKAYVIPIGHLQGGAAFLVFIGVCVLALIGYGLYTTFGKGGKDLKDQIKEHARMHELGIAHGHNDKGAFPSVRTKHQHKHD